MAWLVFTALKSALKKFNAEMLKVITDIRQEMTLQNHWNTQLLFGTKHLLSVDYIVFL